MEISEISMTRGDIQNFCVGVRDPWRYLKFLCECKRLAVQTEKFCCLREKTHSHGYHVALELSDRSRE